MIGIVVSTKIEWDEILKIYNIPYSLVQTYPFGDYYKTVIFNKDVVLFRTLGRKALASASVQYMIDKFNLEKVINIGCATAICDYVDYLDIFIPSSCAEYDLTIRELEPLIKENSIVELSGVNVSQKYFDGLLGTSDKSLVTNKDYMMVKETDMVASDTEASSIAKVCKLNNVEIVIIKGISDRPIVNSGYDEQYEVYEENAPVIIKNIIENYIPEVL